MAKVVATTAFDYGQLDGDTWKFVQDSRDEIRRLGKQTVESIVEIGRLLTEVKARLPHGQWLPWLEAEFAWSESTARRFMDSHTLVKSSNLEDLPKFLELPPSAVADLAARATPEPARREVLDQVAAGKKPTTSAVKETIHKHKLDRAREQAKHLRVEPFEIKPGAIHITGGTNSYREALKAIEPNVGAATIEAIRKGKIKLATYEVKRIAELPADQQATAIARARSVVTDEFAARIRRRGALFDAGQAVITGDSIQAAIDVIADLFARWGYGVRIDKGLPLIERPQEREEPAGAPEAAQAPVAAVGAPGGQQDGNGALTKGQRIKAWREAAELTLRDAAARLRTSHSRLSTIENGKVEPSVEVWAKFEEIQGAAHGNLP